MSTERDASTSTIRRKQESAEDVPKVNPREREAPRAVNADHLCHQQGKRVQAATARNDHDGAAKLPHHVLKTPADLPHLAKATEKSQGAGQRLPTLIFQGGSHNRSINAMGPAAPKDHFPTTGLQGDETLIGVQHTDVWNQLRTLASRVQHQTAKRARNLAGSIATVYAKTVPHAVNGMPTLADTC